MEHETNRPAIPSSQFKADESINPSICVSSSLAKLSIGATTYAKHRTLSKPHGSAGPQIWMMGNAFRARVLSLFAKITLQAQCLTRAEISLGTAIASHGLLPAPDPVDTFAFLLPFDDRWSHYSTRYEKRTLFSVLLEVYVSS